MPPRYAYWTILIDQKPTAFRAREREELLPTLHQLRRKNSDVAVKWFARGKLWDSPAAAQAAQHAPRPVVERRGRDWRPGGEHRDPRDRFKKPARPTHRPHTASGRTPTDRKPKPFVGRAKDHRGPKPFQSHGKGTRDATRKSSSSRPAGQSPKPWQRDRFNPGRHRDAPARPKPDKPWTPPIAKSRKPPEDE